MVPDLLTRITDPGTVLRADEYGDISSSPGIPGWFIALAVLMVAGSIIAALVRVSMARDMASRSGMSPGEATAMTLLTDDGLEATYLAANLRPPVPGTPSEEPSGRRRPTAERLRELDDLLASGAITEAEHADARARILGDL